MAEDWLEEIEHRHKFELGFYTTNPSFMKNLADNHIKATADREVLLQEVQLLRFKLGTRKLKIERQAEVITRLEKSRRDLRAINRDIQSAWDHATNGLIRLGRERDESNTMLDEAHRMVWDSFIEWAKAIGERDEARNLARRFYKLFMNAIDLLGWHWEATRNTKWVSEESDEALVWDILEFLMKFHPHKAIREQYKIEYEKVTGYEVEK